MNAGQPEEKNPTLEQAWGRFYLYNKNAMRQQFYFRMEQGWILFLGVLVTALALTKTHLLERKLIESDFFIDLLLKYFILLLPITIAVLTASANRAKEGNKWILLRAGAETIKREIFRYRMFKKVLPVKPGELTWEEKLAEKLKKISEKLIKTEVNTMALRRLKEKELEKLDDEYKNRLDLLDPGDYIKERVDNQIDFFRNRTKKFEKKLKLLNRLIYIIGGFGTLLAAMELQLWVAMTTTLAGTITTYLQYRQVESTLMIYNQAETNLSNIKLWWTALPDEKKSSVDILKALVENTETALQDELSGWVQYMEDALSALYEPQKPDSKE
jgi:hypothetical protein